MEKTTEKTVAIRAIPAGHHQIRHAAQRPWGREWKFIRVSENAKPITESFDHESGRTRHRIPDELSPADLAEVRADKHMVVVDKVDELRAALATLEQQRAAVAATEAAIAALEASR